MGEKTTQHAVLQKISQYKYIKLVSFQTIHQQVRSNNPESQTILTNIHLTYIYICDVNHHVPCLNE